MKFDCGQQQKFVLQTSRWLHGKEQEGRDYAKGAEDYRWMDYES
jgi:hypothetical protein